VVKMYQGKFHEALELIDDGLAADSMEGAKGRWNAEKHRLQACIFRERRDLEAAVREAQTCLDIRSAAYPKDPVNTRDFCICVLLEAGRLQEADSLANEMKRGLNDLGRGLARPYLQTKGSIALARGDTASAIALWEQALEESTMPPFMFCYQLGQTYLATARLDLAVELLESSLNRYDESRALAPIQSVKAHYLLGRAYEESGWRHRAVEQYEIFLRILREADTGLVDVTDARERLIRLSS
jgi:tetratricopeptide (TPR) repeat protein